jgi:serine/threonine protein kinase
MDNHHGHSHIKPAVFIHKHEGKVTDIYTLGKLLGSGSYGSVNLAIHKETGEERAIKMIKTSKMLKN